MKKIAITLTEEQAAGVEKLRRRRRVPRSRVIQEAVSRYLESEGASSLVQAYETGYRRLPVGVREARARFREGARVPDTFG